MTEEIMRTLGGIMITIIGYFLREAHVRIKTLEQQAIQNEKEIALLKAEQKQGFKHLGELIDQRFASIDTRLTHLDSNLNRLLIKD